LDSSTIVSAQFDQRRQGFDGFRRQDDLVLATVKHPTTHVESVPLKEVD
jgi:hypothetical protein